MSNTEKVPVGGDPPERELLVWRRPGFILLTTGHQAISLSCEVANWLGMQILEQSSFARIEGIQKQQVECKHLFVETKIGSPGPKYRCTECGLLTNELKEK